MKMNKELVDQYGHKLIDIPKNIKGNKILVIDSDFLSFKIASVLENKCIQVYDNKNNHIGKFKHRTEFKSSSKFDPYLEVRDEQILKKDYKTSMLYLFNKFIKEYQKATDTTEVILVGGGPTNFRDRLPLPNKYKGNREGSLRPLALKETKEFGLKNYPSITSEDCEADDICSMFQYRSSIDKDNYIVVCSPDKDQFQVQGNLYIPDQKLYKIEGLGKVSLKQMASKKKLMFEGRKALYVQAGLIGDITDNYLPCDLYKINKGISKKSPIITDLKAYELLKDCQTDKECLQVIYNQYKQWYPKLKEWKDWQGNTIKGDTIDLMQIYFNAAFMFRFPGDKIDIRALLKRQGII